MALSTGQTRAAWRQMLTQDTGLGNTFTKPDLAAAVTAVDAWVDTNTTSYNNALPQPFRGTATPQQKALLLALVAMKRTGVL